MFSSSNSADFRTIRALAQSGILVPHDFSVVGFDDLPFVEMTAPSLTTVALPEY